MFGLGYVAAEDRLFFMDALRHVGRGELSSFAGGALAGVRQYQLVHRDDGLHATFSDGVEPATFDARCWAVVVVSWALPMTFSFTEVQRRWATFVGLVFSASRSTSRLREARVFSMSCLSRSGSSAIPRPP